MPTTSVYSHCKCTLGKVYYKWRIRYLISVSGTPVLVDKVFPVHAGSRGFNSFQWHMSEWFFQSNRPVYPHQVCSELEVAVCDCSVTECQQWYPPYQTGKGVHVHVNTLQTRRRRTHSAGCVRPWFHTAKPLRIDWD